ncbi:MAG: hypothetical protein FD124_1151 [Alphaproteobacteria bacterium]|nr:MAG: hypothetical protein FD160_1849 [Caulobacteraceae bacterium]TPW07399.1 MAG: hypothetical protein FD124_1151 [Alphaproteobacteria bacterium]
MWSFRLAKISNTRMSTHQAPEIARRMHRLLKALTEAPTNAARAALQALADDPDLKKHRDVFVYNLDQQVRGAAQRSQMNEASALS